MNRCFCYCYTLVWFLLIILLLLGVGVEALLAWTGGVSNSEDVNLNVNVNVKTLRDDFELAVVELAWSDLNIVKALIAAQVDKGSKSTDSQTIPIPIPQQVTKYIEDFRRGNGMESMDLPLNWTRETAKNISKNPISVIRLLHRYSMDLPKLLELPLDPIFDEAKAAIVEGSSKWRWPDLRDVDYAYVIDGLLGIQLLYDLSAEQVAEGRLPGIDLGRKLEAKHCFEIGVSALSREKEVYAVDWLELALSKLGDSHGDLDHSLSDEHEKLQRKTQAALKRAIQTHDKMYKMAGGDVDHFLYDHPLVLPGAKNPVSNSKRVTRRKVLLEQFKDNPEQVEIRAWGLCAGENYQTEKEKSVLFCWYEFKSHPKLLIGPIKKEFISRDPDIVMMYDMVGDSAIKKLRRAFRDKRSDSRYSQDDDYVFHPPEERDGQGSTRFIQDGHGTPFGLLSVPKNLEAATGFKIAGKGDAEKLFMRLSDFATFGFVHYDYNHTAGLTRPMFPVACALHYLSDVAVGGGTVFPGVGVGVKPLKGAVVMWFNTLSDGSLDKALSHKACPVLFGRKLIGNKWIRSEPNMFTDTLKCATKPSQRLTVKVNGVSK